MSEPRSVRVRITGRVQGVFFRDWTMQEARARGVDGWVRNRADGSVEAVFSGDAGAVSEMIELCRSGPPAASVADIAEEETEPPPEPGFHKRPTV